ncbi:interleukin-21 isoform X1 [Larimichthys crocea]|uniref:interleukin-21 isoform X1 n=1 Tax=Larimichthys crocea TaxID=215358 RepID=UPI000F5D5A80|nr:uncharacterized protein LOC109138412 isoform X1 [Larimichthys crocea]XP_027135258.1 uncharacterized protein LOC109138412 isoform X1 [Larimichthys crocea]
MAAAIAPLIQNENGKCRLPVVSCRVHSNNFTFTHSAIGPTHARLDATLGSRSGDCQWKRKFHYSHTPVYTWWSGFPVSSGISIKSCCALANKSSNKQLLQRRKFNEIIRQMEPVQASLQLNGQMLHTPPNNITDCCFLSALRCFRTSLQMQFDIEKNHKLFSKSLRHHITVSAWVGVRIIYCVKICLNAYITFFSTSKTNHLFHPFQEEGMNFCDSGNNSTCQECHTHPKKNVTEFFDRLKTLLQRVRAFLSWFLFYCHIRKS